MNAYRKLSFALAALMAVSLISCGGSGDTPAKDTTTASGDSEDTTVAENAYNYPAVDLGEEEFVILNTPQPYNFYSALDFEEQTGDALDDAIYMRNRTVEDKFNFKLVVNEEYSLKEANTALETSVLAGDDDYDAAFLRDMWISSQLTQNMFTDLSTVKNFNFDQPWWDQFANDTIKIGKNKAMFYAYSDISFADFEGALCIFFNEDMTESLGLDFPYDTVRNGKWTLDELGKYMKAGANLNGQENFNWNEAGTATYGLTTWDQGSYGTFMGCGFDFINMDKDGNPSIAPFNDAYVSAMQKIITMYSVEGEYLFNNNSGSDNYEAVFKNGRALTMIAQLKATNKYRDMEANFGILPMPKLDEAQEKYRCMRSYSYVMAVPVTNQELETTAAVMDALAYHTYTDVMDTFYNGRVSQKSLRNEDSVEMLGIIRDSRVIDIGVAYGWSSELRAVIDGACGVGDTDVVSKLESNRPSIEAAIKSVMNEING